MTPFFSLVIPTYNRLHSVQLTLDSALKQSYDNYEVIVIDDGSSDGTFDTLSLLYSKMPHIKIIHQENKERGAARNNGLKQAKGKYVQFIDSDDLLLPNHLEILFRKIIELNFPDFICTKYELFRDGRSYPSASLGHLMEKYYDYRLFLTGNPLACNICVKKDNAGLMPFEENRKYSIKEDWMFLLQNLRHNKVYIINEVTVIMGDHDDRSMRSNNLLIIERTFLARDWIMQHIQLNKSETKILDAHVNYFSSIHSYIDNRRKASAKYLLKSISLRGIQKKYFSLLLKIVLGKNLVDQFKRLFH